MAERSFLPVLFGAIILGSLAAWFFLGRSEIALQRSLMGNSGLVVWLKSEGHPISRHRVGNPDLQTLGLRILPLHDTDLFAMERAPRDQQEYLYSATDKNIGRIVLKRKVQQAPTLVIYPKWQRAMRLSGYAHESLRAPLDEVQRVLGQSFFSFAKIRRPKDRTMEFKQPGVGTAVIFAPQVFTEVNRKKCSQVIGDAEVSLLIVCKNGDGLVWLLSDPDLLNNHGLSLGDNARIGANFLAGVAGGKRIILDETVYEYTAKTGEPHMRSWADLARFFSFPLLMLWIGAGVLMGLLLWRSFVRARPVRRVFDDQIGASKTVSLRAKARLFRAAGHDAELMEAHVTERCQAAAAAIFGPHRRAGSAMLALLQATQRKNPDLARRFEAAYNDALAAPTRASQQDLLARLQAFEAQLYQVKHEFGRA